MDAPDYCLSQSYHPSTLILVAVLFFTLESAITELVFIIFAILFSVTTYGPTLYFAVTQIFRNNLKRPHTDDDVLKASKRATVIACSWIVTVTIHFLSYLSERHHDMTSGLILVPTFGGIPVTILMTFISLRYFLDSHWIQKVDRRRTLNTGVEGDNVTLLSPFSDSDGVQSSPSQHAHTLLYQPSTRILGISVSLTVAKVAVNLAIRNPDTTSISLLFVALVYIPTLVIQLYLISRLRLGEVLAFEEVAQFGGWFFDLFALWVVAQLADSYIISVSVGKSLAIVKAFVNGAGGLSIGYITLLYLCSVFREWESVKVSLPTVPENRDDVNQPTLDESRAREGIEQESHLYSPSSALLAVLTAFSVACAITETLAESVCGVPMTILVYIPTLYLSLSVISTRVSSNFVTLKVIPFISEKWKRICGLWILTQAFYVLLWPVSPYLNASVMKPLARYPAVAISMYIAARYSWQDYLKRRRQAIHLTEDTERSTTSTNETVEDNA